MLDSTPHQQHKARWRIVVLWVSVWLMRFGHSVDLLVIMKHGRASSRIAMLPEVSTGQSLPEAGWRVEQPALQALAGTAEPEEVNSCQAWQQGVLQDLGVGQEEALSTA